MNNNVPAIIYKEINIEMMETTSIEKIGLVFKELPNGDVMNAQAVLHGHFFSMFTMLFLVETRRRATG